MATKKRVATKTIEIDFPFFFCVCVTEFVYPSNWVGDQTILYRAAGKAERSRDLPSLSSSNGDRRGKNVNEPVVAFGPPGSNGELNVSVIVAKVPIDFW